ncbi:MAG: aminotransferase class IV [Planctomycetes bacterium]|nr:aminotransferase class IV [Planctomycetota bacterium]
MNTSLPKPYPVWIDGRFVEPFSPAIAAEDPGFSLGLAVFETLLYERGVAYFAREHFERLAEGARTLGIPWPPPHSLERALDAYLDALGGVDCAVRITLTRGVPGRGASLVLGARDVVRPEPRGAKLVISRFVKLHSDPFERVKSTNRLRNVLAREEAVARGGWDALFATEEGDFAEGTWCNLFVLSKGRLLTPALERGCLAGIVRGRLQAELAARPLAFPWVEGRVERADLLAADEVFATNTTNRIVPVVEVDGLRTGLPGASGPVVQELRARMAAIEERHRSELGGRRFRA